MSKTEVKSSIALIGFMGAGKSEVGRVLAQKLGKRFVEMDALIARKAGKSIAEIFEQDGETAFRQLESEVAREVAGKKDLVIACGGGIVLNQNNIHALEKEAVIIYLKATPQALWSRLKTENGERPLLKVTDKAAKIEELMRFRKRLYESSAEITIDTSDLSIEAVVDEIMTKLKSYERTSR